MNDFILFKIDPEPPVQPPEDFEKEKSLVEILLRKYGFGRWTLPVDDSGEAEVSPECCKVMDIVLQI